MTLDELKSVYATSGEVAVRLCIPELTCSFVQFVEAFPSMASLWQASSADWLQLVVYYPKHRNRCDLSMFDENDWVTILLTLPQYKSKCDFTKFSGKSWVTLLYQRKNLALYCDWSKLNSDNWRMLNYLTANFYVDQYNYFELSQNDLG